MPSSRRGISCRTGLTSSVRTKAVPVPATGPFAAPVEQLIRTCPNCGRTLAERKCKLFCPDPRCGYYLSCADYY